jgi:hypothetical protein
LPAVQIGRIVPLRCERLLEVDEILFEEGGTSCRQIERFWRDIPHT